MSNLNSSAPHIHNACDFGDLVDWGAQPDAISGASHSTGRLLHKGPDNIPEPVSGIALRDGGVCPYRGTNSATLFLAVLDTNLTVAK